MVGNQGDAQGKQVKATSVGVDRGHQAPGIDEQSPPSCHPDSPYQSAWVVHPAVGYVSDVISIQMRQGLDIYTENEEPGTASLNWVKLFLVSFILRG